MTGSDTETLRPWQRSAIGDRRSVVGALVILLVAASYVIGVPYLEDNVEARGILDGSGRFVVDEYTTMRLADGWTIDSRNDLLTTLTDGTYQLIVVVSNPADGSAEEALQDIHAAFSDDPSNTVTPIVTFATDAGGDGAAYRAVLASDPSGNGSASYAVVQNGRSFQPLATGPDDLTDPYYEGIDAMVRSVEITAEPGDGGP